MPRMRRWTLVGALLLVTGCTELGSGDETTVTSEGPPTAQPNTTTTLRPETDEILEDLDGELCPDSVFTCITLDMPLDHFDPSEERTIPITFAVKPASEETTGVFVTATGGPGSSGISSADSYTDALDAAIPEQYDIVFNGAAPTGGNQSSPGRYSGQDNGWVALYINPQFIQFFEELKTHPNIPYKPWGEGLFEIIPPEYR